MSFLHVNQIINYKKNEKEKKIKESQLTCMAVLVL